MRRLLQGVQDAWCLVTHRCRVVFDDPAINHLRAQERAALHAAADRRARRQSRDFADIMAVTPFWRPEGGDDARKR